MEKDYNESSIQVLEGLDAVRKRPGMYIGSTDSRGLHHLIWEIVDNSVDEALAGYGNVIELTIHKDNSITVKDEGRGVPVGMHASGVSTPQLIFSTLHAGGKFGGDGYKTSGGLHGVGASVVNALSIELSATICREGHEYFISFKDGGKLDQPLKTVKKSSKTGTTTYFKPDPSIFINHEFNYSVVCERMRETAFLMRGLKTVVIDERTDSKEEYYYENGLSAFVEFLNEDKTELHKTVYFNSVDVETEISVECAFQYTNSFNENIISFANNIRTHEGGTHETGAKSAFTKVLNDYARVQKLLKDKKNLDGNDLREGLTLCISVKVPEKYLILEGQTKSKLGTSEARRICESIVAEHLNYFLHENVNVSKVLVSRALEAQVLREQSRKQKENNKKTKSSKQLFLSGKLTPAQHVNPKKNELYIVEGDSAGGSAKQGRNREFQAILPLRGKVINSERAKVSDIFKNEEINSMIYAIGAGVGHDFNLEESNYDKIILMTDADTDGAHIQVLLLTFFYRFMKPLVEAGKIYIALPPLYKITSTKKSSDFEYAWNDEELAEITKKYPTGYLIQRYKGLGEMNADQLWDTTMDPAKRTLIQVSIEDFAIAEKRVSVLMGEKVEPRRKWIESNVKFTLDSN